MTRSQTGPLVSPVRPGETFAGKYLVEKILGTGGMGVVLAAHHPQLGQKVAIKLLLGPLAGKPEIAARFLREARAAAQLRNQHIARVMDAGTDEAGRQYIVMEHLNGSDLRAHYKKEGPRPIPVTVGYVLHACEALAEAHTAGIVHRDLKPENLFLTAGADGSPLIKVLDFGISKNLQISGDPSSQIITTDQDILGSPAYMSPEQLRSPDSVDARTDVWALGVILYELLTTSRPFTPPALADLIAEVLSLTPPPPHTLNADIPEKLSAVVMQCLAKKADNRLRSVGELAEALRPWAPRWARESVVRAARTSLGKRGDPSQSADLPAPGDDPEQARSRIRWASLLPVGLAMIAGVVFLALARKPAEVAPATPLPAAPALFAPPPAPAAAEPALVAPPPAPAAAEPAPGSTTPATSPVVDLPPTPEPAAAQPEEVAPAAAPDASGKARRVARPQPRRTGDRAGNRIGGAKPTGRLGAAEIDPLEGRR